MSYKIETKYTYGWDDAGWTDDIEELSFPTRFETIEDAESELAAFFERVKQAVAEGDMDSEKMRSDFRIVEFLR